MSARYASRTLIEKFPASRPSQYVCRRCQQNTNASTHVLQQRRYASEETRQETLLEKTRKKLWKGQPPGPENVDDLYGGPGVLATAARERRERIARARAEYRTQGVAGRPANEGFLTPPVQTSELKGEESVISKAPEYEQVESQPTGQLTEAEYEAAAAAVEDDEPVQLAKNVTTWDGLEAIGYAKDEWDLKPANAVDDYRPWQIMDNKLDWSRDELVALMAIAAGKKELGSLFVNGTPAFFPGDAHIPQPSVAEEQSLLERELDLGFATVKLLSRFTYLVRRRVPDTILTKLTKGHIQPTVGNFLEMFAEKTKPKPANVAEVLTKNEKLDGHGNILVFPRRETPVDKEKEVGRWKVIEAELRARGLPTLGRYHERRY